MDFNLGDIIEVTVTGIENYGIFVSVNDEYTGLIHISEIDNNFVNLILIFSHHRQNILNRDNSIKAIQIFLICGMHLYR